MPEQLLPIAPEAERMVLGSVMQNHELLHAVRPALTAEDFATEEHRRIWIRCCGLYDAGKPVDRITVFMELQKHGEHHVASLSYLASLDDGLPQMPNVDAYVKLVRDKATLRRIIFASQNMANRCFAGEETPQQILDSVSQSLLELAPQEPGRGLQSCGELVDEVGLSKLLRPRREQGLTFPWAWMNRSTSGMLPAELWILAAGTSVGKTSAALQLATHVARQGKGVAIFTLEVGKPNLFLKAVYQLSGVDSEAAKRGVLSKEERDAISAAARELYGMPLYFDAQSNSVMAIHAAVRRRRLKNPIDLVIVDYLQLLADSGKHQNRAQSVGANAWALKMLASEFQVPVLLLSQFSRQAPPKPGMPLPRPELGWLKESGDIENHANGVWFIHRESLESMAQAPVEFMLPKQRDGRRNISSGMWFYERSQRFEEREFGGDD